MITHSQQQNRESSWLYSKSAKGGLLIAVCGGSIRQRISLRRGFAKRVRIAQEKRWWRVRHLRAALTGRPGDGERGRKVRGLAGTARPEVPQNSGDVGTAYPLRELAVLADKEVIRCVSGVKPHQLTVSQEHDSIVPDEEKVLTPLVRLLTASTFEAIARSFIGLGADMFPQRAMESLRRKADPSLRSG